MGIRPTTPQNADGCRIDPPVSEPSAAKQRPAATAAPAPLDDPPEMCSIAHGFATRPKKLVCLRRRPEGDFVHVQLAQKDGPGVAKPLDDDGILAWNAILEQRAPARRPDACGVDQVLESDRNTVKRPSPLPTLHFSLGLTRLRERRFTL